MGNRLLTRRRPGLKGRVALVLLRWPPPSSFSSGSRGDTADPLPQLSACADLLRSDGHTVVILTPPAGHYRDYAATLIPVARRAGLGYLQHIVVITAATTPASGDDVVADSGNGRSQAYLDLLVFIPRHGGAENTGPRTRQSRRPPCERDVLVGPGDR